MAALSTAFDYGFLPSADGKALERRAENIQRIQERVRRQTAEGVIKLGVELQAAREILSNHGNGTFGHWVEERLGIGRTTAHKTLTAMDAFKDCSHCERFDPSAMYLLSADTCPEAAFDKAIEAAESGEVVTHKRAKEIIAEFTPAADDDEAEPESQSLALHDLLENLNQVMEEMESKWPEEFREVLGHKLVAMGECILEMSAKQEVEAA